MQNRFDTEQLPAPTFIGNSFVHVMLTTYDEHPKCIDALAIENMLKIAFLPHWNGILLSQNVRQHAYDVVMRRVKKKENEGQITRFDKWMKRRKINFVRFERSIVKFADVKPHPFYTCR